MNPSYPQRRRRGQNFGVESLEGRELLTGGAGSTFAIMPGSITKAGGTATISFTIDPTHFTMPRSGKLLLGIDVATQSGQSLKPLITTITDSQGHTVHGTLHSRYDPKVARSANLNNMMTTAAITPVSFAPGNKPATYTITVQGQDKTSGSFLVGFYLAGDANGDGTVNSTDLTKIKQEMGLTANSGNYNFDADGNRDGLISRADLTIAQRNLGAATTISPSVTANLDPSYENQIGSQATSFSLVHFTGTVTPGATVTFTNTSHTEPTASTVADSKGSYGLMVALGAGSNVFQVSSHDAFNQTISGKIAPVTYNPATSTVDVTAGTPTSGTLPNPSPASSSSTPSSSTTPTSSSTSSSTSTSSSNSSVTGSGASGFASTTFGTTVPTNSSSSGTNNQSNSSASSSSKQTG